MDRLLILLLLLGLLFAIYWFQHKIIGKTDMNNAQQNIAERINNSPGTVESNTRIVNSMGNINSNIIKNTTSKANRRNKKEETSNKSFDLELLNSESSIKDEDNFSNKSFSLQSKSNYSGLSAMLENKKSFEGSQDEIENVSQSDKVNSNFSDFSLKS